MKDDKYIVINGWMVNGLNLKGNTLLVFAIIHGFSRDGSSKFTGSLNYLVEATNTSKNTVLKSLKELVEKQIVVKQSEVVNNITFNKYFTNQPVVQKLNNLSKSGSETEQQGGSEIAPVGGAETEHNKPILKTPIKNNTLFDLEKEVVPKSVDVLDYLNNKKPSKIPFKPTRGNLKDIEARIKEKFTIEDFQKVIESKVNEWKDNDKMKKYIRPETLFGSKFNSYLVQASENGVSDGSGNFEFNPTEKAELL